MKYQNMGSEIEVIYTEIKKYEHKLKNNISVLNQLAEHSVNYYFDLEKYIAAGELVADNLRNQQIPLLQEKVMSGNQMANIELNRATSSLDVLEQRLYDLTMAKQVALQTWPQLYMQQKANATLIGKINSAFVITIPVFKSSLIQAVVLKQQRMTAEAMSELDKRTNEMLVKNAKNFSQNSIEITKLASNPTIKIETMEQTWKTIMNGLAETQKIEKQNAIDREKGKKRLLELQENYTKSNKRIK
jgi:uncharacterized protein YaaN involved in tellurite resistance